MSSVSVRRGVQTLAEMRKRRLSLGISLGELARAVGRSDATVSRIERGRIRPSYDLVQKIVAFLDEREGERTPPLTASEVRHGPLVTVAPTLYLSEAFRLMERGGFSQLPVVEEDRVVGSLSESALLRALASPAGRRGRVREYIEPGYPIVDVSCPADLLTGLLTRYPAVLVSERGALSGIVTKTDLIRGLRGMPLRREAPTGAG
ncbi:MAG: CBS domain-containing protein [Thermoplasmata archaeon]|nr:CBS domain-containing protein [Thermoplasmata archaeon]MCI4341552.1 CBS domain-containing protein [Thermoplasmata archaeon]